MTPKPGALRAVLISGAGFAGGFLAGGAAWWAMVLSSRAGAQASSADWLASAAVVAWVIGFQAIGNALVFAALTALSRRWRARTPRRLAIASALLGVVAVTLSWTGLAMVVLSPIRGALGVTVAGWLWYAMPALLAAALAVALAGRPARS